MDIDTPPAQPEPDIWNQLPREPQNPPDELNHLPLTNATQAAPRVESQERIAATYPQLVQNEHRHGLQPDVFLTSTSATTDLEKYPSGKAETDPRSGHIAFSPEVISSEQPPSASKLGSGIHTSVQNAFRRRPAGGNQNGLTTAVDGPGANARSGSGMVVDPARQGEKAKVGKVMIKQPNWSTSLKNTVKSSYVNYLVVFIPVSWALHFSGQGDVIVFVFSLIAVIPLASLLSFATEELSLHVGEALGGLLNASFGNAVELLIAILALVKGDIDLVQASMVGSIVSNTLLVLGMSYFAGGLRFHEQVYLVAGSNTMISMLGLSMAAILLPAGFHYSFPSTQSSEAGRPYLIQGEEQVQLLRISRGLSFILLAAYALYLVFILYTHAYLFRIPRAPRPHTLPGAPHPPTDKVFPRPRWVPSMRSNSTASTDDLDAVISRDSITSPPTRTGTNLSTAEAGQLHSDVSASNALEADEAEEEVEEPLIKWQLAVCLLLGTTAITGVTAEWLIDSIDGLTEQTNISREFVGLILLPVIGNAVEHIAAVTVSVKDKLNLSMAIAIGSSIQVALGLLPVLVLIGWAIGQPMMLFFDTFETFVLTVSLLVVNFAIADGKTNYLEGGVLMLTWIMIATTCWFYDPLV